ncbi:class I SAM-dependent methyltransferase [Streptomyces hesseae]|uniref:Class I SAM-dependent methyltransferase n=1 Tax=Streptomyces hesseae TaxID=3075519 RepID=A0ABU2SHN6_9ACTN|nr:class I SAM-dependent methyltransferase [Streptomyces sp. DSM 40473]MDT0448156.1 class I SAM-dependent methyltransferase [Streptomyces sp. DSM 40473]
MTTTPPRGYVFDNENENAAEQHRCLAAAYDPFTTRRLARLGVGPGARVLEVGAGGGSVARWLAGRVAPTGSVLATDVTPLHLAPAPGLRVLTHDITSDPLPENEFDVIHARLVLLHLPGRLDVLRRLVAALRPGGRLQLDEFDETTYGPLIPVGESGDAARAAYGAYLDAKIALLESAGAGLTWGRDAATAMHGAGLTDVDAEPEVQRWRAGSPGTALQIHNTWHLRDRFLAAGLTDEGLEAARAAMSHPDFLAASCLMYSVQGRKPGTAGHV